MKDNKLYGLVLVGGRSKRMKQDKASIEFHNQKQSVHCYNLLSNVCEKTFISNRADQKENKGQKEFPQIHDKKPFIDVGPLGGILTAMKEHPDISWLVIACDLPFLEIDTINNLISNRDTTKLATAYISENDGLPEPLCTIWESHAFETLLNYFNNDGKCPRKFLINNDAKLIKLLKPTALDNINFPEELDEATKIIDEKINDQRN